MAMEGFIIRGKGGWDDCPLPFPIKVQDSMMERAAPYWEIENRGANREGPGRGDGDREDKILFPLHLLVLLSSVLWYVLHVTCYM